MQLDRMVAVLESGIDQALEQIATEVALTPDFERVALMHTLGQHRAHGCAFSKLIAGLASLGFAVAAAALIRRQSQERSDGPATD